MAARITTPFVIWVTSESCHLVSVLEVGLWLLPLRRGRRRVEGASGWGKCWRCQLSGRDHLSCAIFH